MSILIKDMEMPPECHGCRWFYFQGMSCTEPRYYLDARCELVESGQDWYGKDYRGGWIGESIEHIPGWAGYYPHRHCVEMGTRASQCPLCDLPSAQPEPCEDAVSRPTLLRMYQDVCNGIACVECQFYVDSITDCKLEKFIRQLPSVTPVAPTVAPTDVPTEDCISRKDAIRIASGYCHPANIPKELAKLPSVTPKTDVPDIDVGKIECEDAISRKDALKLFATHDGKYLYDAIQTLPSVTVGTQMSLPECEDAVSRAKLQEKLQWIIDHGLPSSDGKHSLSAEYVLEYVNSLPSVTPQKTGKWKVYEVANADGEPPIAWQCPNCEEVVETLWKYCPECGLEMEGQE